jgi:hypothetical protein
MFYLNGCLIKQPIQTVNIFIIKFIFRNLYFLVQYDECLQSTLKQFSSDAADMNAIFNHEPIHYGEIVSLPFTGW